MSHFRSEAGSVVIETERLRLRPHRLDDYEDMVALSSDPEVMRFITSQPPTREEIWHRLMRYAGHWALLGYGLLAIEERVSGRFVGETGVADFHRGLGPDFDGFPEAAWMLGRAAQGKGYASEAAAAAIRWADAHFGGTRMVCLIDPANAASLGVAGKCGFRRFGETRYRDKPVIMFERDPAHLPKGDQPR
ncbi:GNAT family N-acetyltransferase [Sphingomonas oleivorans]|uniref:GNAT family N-acetyltransferase n=2 Tax=Sphingomonas oleivorans TaxID=1735121 RepID=A0A2T5G151_9SPHN|nr:GNAT family N-acetyltransferase [Sphingomonas oleivorans]